ncbi:MAG: alpha-hydroxy-acid oxidizing protein [Acidobacteria bacterium]|nr:alpha-hydroxy-acid oxidizing protein [Acidobacteriota bacterium]
MPDVGRNLWRLVSPTRIVVGIGRPYVWGLAGFGQEGVEAVIDLLRRELRLYMAATSATSISKITRASLVTRS